MLTIADDRPALARREFLRIGGLALGGLSLSQLLAAEASAGHRGSTDKSVILLFMQGGPSQFETFDPHMSAADGVRCVTGEISTSLPGVTIGSTYEKLARLAHRTTIVRSFTGGDAKHDIKPVVSQHSLNANLGALYSRVLGSTNLRTGMPTNAALFPQSVDDQAGAEQQKFGKFTSSGALGAAYSPFVPGSGGPLQENMTLSLSRERLDDRRGLLNRLDGIRRSIDTLGLLEGMDKFQQQAFQTILSGAAEALDLSKEDPRTIERYDTSRLVRPDQIDRKWNNYKHYVDHGRSLGKLLLLARRLCEAGCRFVTVTTNFVWDNHADANNAGVAEGMRYCGLPFDHAVSAFLEDVESRGLSEKIMLVCTGEMGRTPKVNARGGRDHWGGLAPLLMAGGGWPMGRVIGQSTRDGGEPATRPITIPQLIGSITHTLFDIAQLRLERGLPSDLMRLLTEQDPIAELA